MSDKTIFQKIIDREEPATIHFEDEDCIIIDAKFPSAGTEHHFLVIPKQLITSVMTATEEDARTVGLLHIRAASFMKARGIQNYKLCFNAGKYLHVPHLHLHVVTGDNLHD